MSGNLTRLTVKRSISRRRLGRSIRFPFTDNRLASFVQGLPEQLKYRDGVNKQILRAYMKQSLPREIVEKPKSGFIFDSTGYFANPMFAWQDELDRAGLLQALPTWSRAPIVRTAAAPQGIAG